MYWIANNYFNVKGKQTTYHSTKNISFHQQKHERNKEITYSSDIFSSEQISSSIYFVKFYVPLKWTETFVVHVNADSKLLNILFTLTLTLKCWFSFT